MSNDATVFVVDDDERFRERMIALLRAPEARVEGVASAEEFLTQYQDQPGCVVAPLDAGGPQAVSLQDELRARTAAIPIVLVADRAPTSAVVRAMQRGAVTVLDKQTVESELPAAVETALALDAKRRARRDELARIRERFATLSEKERDVLRLIVAGRPNKAMANALNASLRTIENRRREVFAKLGVRSVAELVTLSLKLQAAGIEL